MKKYAFILIFIITACVSGTKRSPSSENKKLLDDLNHFREVVQSGLVDQKSCPEYFGQAVNLFFDERIYDYSPEDKEALKNIIRSTWQTRLAIHSHLADYHQACTNELRQIFYKLRSIEDLADIAYYKEEPLSAADFTGEKDFQKQQVPLVQNEFYHGYLGAQGQFETMEDVKSVLKNGDMMVTIGASDFSAVLATMPEYPGFLDHLVYIHKDEEHGLQSIESYATPQGEAPNNGTGVQFYDIDFALKNVNPRILLLRLKPQYSELAEKAANDFYDLVIEKRKSKQPITYDYLMKVTDPSKMTCASVPLWALRNASHDQFVIPEQKSNLRAGLEPIYKSTGMNTAPLLTASDIELDSRFDLLLEFRDHRLIEDIRIRHIAARVVENWMIEKDYRLLPTYKTILLNLFIFPLHLEKLASLPPGAPPGFVKTLDELTQTIEVLVAQLKKQQSKRRAEHKWSMSLNEMMAFLETYRQNEVSDCQNSSNAKRGPLHLHFAPANFTCVKATY